MRRDTIDLAFGRGHLPVRIDDGVLPTVIRKRTLPKLADPRAAIGEAFATPIGAPPLAALAQGRRSACILVCDITRPVPNGLFLRPMIRILGEAGIRLEDITILVATGLHRPNEGAELAELIGDPWVLANVPCVNHFAEDDAAHVQLGRTRTRATPVGIDRRFVDAELRIATGLVEPHFMAGWSGGRKVVAPGVAHHETIRTFHSARFMEDAAAIQCNLGGNPLHEEQLEIVRMLGEIYAMNTVIDEDRDLVHVTFGEIVASHLAAVEAVRDAIRIPVGRRFRTVVTSAAGYPLDRTYYQTVKGMVTPLDILAPGGTLIVASECGEGLGSPGFRAAQARLAASGERAFLDAILAQDLAAVDEWQTEKQTQATRLGRVRLHAPALSPEDRRLTCVDDAPDVAAAIAESVAANGDPHVAFIPEGPYVVPVVA